MIMKVRKSIRNVLLGGLAMASTATALQAEEATDFNQVGKQMSIMLQNRHYDRMPFDDELSQRILKLYLNDLDYGKLFFTQEDVDMLAKKYGNELDDLMIKAKSMDVAAEVYELYQKRVHERIAYANDLLKKGKFNVDSDATMKRARRDMDEPTLKGWPADKKASDELWTKVIEEAYLSEVLRRKTIETRAKEQGKDNPLKDEKPINEKLALRYERILHAADEVDSEDIADYLLSAVAKAYGPHTDYFSAREMDRFMSGMNNGFVGIGALLQAEDDGATKIMGVVVGGPADKGGELKLNDRIIAVDPLNSGEMVDIMFMKIDKVVDMIRGKEGTSVRLKVEPADGGEPKFIVIERGKVEMKDEFAKGQIIESKKEDGVAQRIGVITLPSFYADFKTGEVRCSEDVRVLLERMNEEEVDGLILDLRGNGGGSLDEVRRMTGFFTGAGPVVQVKDYLGRIDMKSSFQKAIFDKPMVCLIDKASASASEILAGALQDYNRAVIIGTSSTFGKGTVQQPMDISRMMPFFAKRDRAGYLKPTIQKFYRVSGSSTQKKGVEADIVLPNIMDALEIGEDKLYYPLAHDVIRKAPGYTSEPREGLFIANLKGGSVKRLAENKDFQYIVEDVNRMKERIEKNEVSLNLKEREKELAEVETRTKERNKERIERFAKMEKQDKSLYTFYRLNLDDVEAKELQKMDPTKDDDSYMRRSEDDDKDLDTTPEWPTRLDPVKRESMAILSDLIELTTRAKMAGVNNE
ncbi:carboxyl-terminal processing protease [Rubritalea squalenifaciens DSM 18772]|uniref:Carboxyl-terminal processing protease n=2 Tax=Rubritalea squalenifaciens TaxID=407226 RepID=A0A1M6LW95_9BACT|nr:carboxyl-terminal processing protease [Rubritalea squalenifaciens DSM 18772]